MAPCVSMRLREANNLQRKSCCRLLQELLTSLITFLLAVGVKFLARHSFKCFRLKSSLAVVMNFIILIRHFRFFNVKIKVERLYATGEKIFFAVPFGEHCIIYAY